MGTKQGMKSTENCGVCGQPLVYGTRAVSRQCSFCGENFTAQIYCPEGHYVCDACHSSEAMDILRSILNSTGSTSPAEIVEKVMAHPSVPMHGPEHHAIVPASLVAAARNAGYPVPEQGVEKAIERGARVPGGWCGLYGTCGAGVGVGTAVSVLTGATPLTGRERGMAIEATSLAMQKMLDGHPRCCKRAVRNAIEAGAAFLRERLGINLSRGEDVKCRYTARNRECAREKCPYYGGTLPADGA